MLLLLLVGTRCAAALALAQPWRHCPLQVHRGVLRGPGSKRVVVKVLLPGVKRQMKADLANMMLGITLLDV